MGSADAQGISRRQAWLAVCVAALGYFVDIYDLVLFAVLRKASLQGLGFDTPADLEREGAMLFTAQMSGMLIGGFAWGMLGDRRGRLSVLFGSIALYSLANLGNAYVEDTTTYAVMRFLAGVGLAGELGAGITLVCEQLPTRLRGYGTMIVAGVGLCGAVVAGLVGTTWGAWLAESLGSTMAPWRMAYIIGGVMGLALLCLRIGVAESAMFARARLKAAGANQSRGSLLQLFWPPRRALRYLCVLLIAVPIWFIGGLVFLFAPELGNSLGLVGDATPSGATAVVAGYTGAVVGDILSGMLSQLVQSRKWAIGVFLTGIALTVALLLTIGGRSTQTFYTCVFLTGLATGYWAMFVTVASESFGTNLRATATTAAPNLVRGAAVPIVFVWQWLRTDGLDAATAAAIVGAVCIALAYAALWALPETFGRDLEFEER